MVPEPPHGPHLVESLDFIISLAFSVANSPHLNAVNRPRMFLFKGLQNLILERAAEELSR